MPKLLKPRSVIDTLINIAIGFSLIIICVLYCFPVVGNSLYVPQSDFKFGSVKPGLIPTGRYELWNIHPWPVTITKIQTSCGCTTAILGKHLPIRLLPFHTVALSVSINAKQRIGFLRESVNVITNDNQDGTAVILEVYVQDNH